AAGGTDGKVEGGRPGPGAPPPASPGRTEQGHGCCRHRGGGERAQAEEAPIAHVIARLVTSLQASSEFSPAPPSSVPPKVLEPVWRHVGVPDRVLDVLVSEVVLQGPRVVAIVGELEPAGMAKHVRVDREWHLGSLTEALDKPVETDRTDWPAALGNEYVGVFGVIAA